MRALISVYEKAGLVPFAQGLADLGFELVASGGTAETLEDAGLEVTTVEDVTGFPEMLGGRVKTLHPRIHAGILARRGFADDLQQLAENEVEPFDLVCVNLYPFELAVDRSELDELDVIEMIDIGGPALLRAAAKNFDSVIAVCRPQDYDEVLRELWAGAGGTSRETRKRLAAYAFARSAAYESAIARWFQPETFPETFVRAFDRELDLAYGENPHQRAAYYAERGVRAQLLSFVEQLQGKPLSFNNLNDLSAARLLSRELDEPACVIVKHANPCGVAMAETIDEAYAKALAADPVSAYGGVVVVNRLVTPALGEALAGQFVEVLFAPGYDEQARDALARKTSTRVLHHTERRGVGDTELDYRRVYGGGLLVQERDWAIDGRDGMDVVCGDVADEQWRDVTFAWRVVKHVTSNAIVLARGGQTLGIGAGQMSRVDAVRIAIDKAGELGHSLEGAVLASDAFFPFADGPQLALDAGVLALVQPGGSKRDAEVIEAVSRASAAMVFTHRRHFRH